MEFTHFALVKIGGFIYGTGVTESAAREDARQFMDSPAQADLAQPTNKRGNICCVPCTESVFNSVQKFGGFKIKDADGQINL